MCRTIALHSTPGAGSVCISGVIGPARVSAAVRRVRIVVKPRHFAISLFAASLLACGGCTSPHGGPILLDWLYSGATYSYDVSGGNGSTPKSTLRIHGYDKEHLGEVESSWVYDHHWMTQTPTPKTVALGAFVDDEFLRSLDRHTERISGRVYDIVLLTLRNGEKLITYFDVTNYRYLYPNDK